MKGSMLCAGLLLAAFLLIWHAQPSSAQTHPIINIKVEDQSGAVVLFKLRTNARLGKVTNSYCNRAQIARDSVDFIFFGHVISDNETPDDLDIYDGDTIYVV